jgi:chemosensory pili system protein ChpA (sensor histidine kinase/response regulator)
MQVLRDAVRAIENVVEHINESTGYFLTHTSIVERIVKLEQALDAELTMMAQAVEATAVTPVPELRATEAPAPSHYNSDEDVIELSFDANAQDDELGLDSPTRFSRALGHSGETIEVAVDQAMMQEALRLGEQNRADQTHTQTQIHTHARAVPGARSTPLHSPAPAPVQHLERTQRIDPPSFPPKVSLSSLDATARNLALPKALNTSATITVRAPIITPPDEFEVSRFDLGGIDVVETTMDMNPPGARAPELIVETAAWAATYEPPTLPAQLLQTQVLPPPVVQPATPAPIAPTPVVQKVVLQPVATVLPPAVADDEADTDADDFDADVAAIFTEEAAELLDVADASLAMWARDRGNNAIAFELKRAIHTLKGGARMAGIRAMGDLSHELESLMEGVESGRIVAEQSVLDLLQASLDELHRMRDTVSQGNRVRPARELMARIRVAMGLAPAVSVAAVPQNVQSAFAPAPSPSTPTEVVDDDAASAELQAEFHVDELSVPAIAPRLDETIDVELPSFVQVEEAPAPEPEFVQAPPSIDEALLEPMLERSIESPPFAAPMIEAIADEAVEFEDVENVETAPGVVAPIALPGRDAVQTERGEVARVDAELLDMLLNNAGEVSILRSRLEQQTNSIDFNLAELARTVTRLKEQLRKLELETEAQILHRHQDENSGRTDFDPLELDRYSTLQQLSRALAESVSDVASIESLLGSQTREAQNLLLQQSRVVTEVQNGLMRTRMVPFQRHVQRLSRIVRQVASETHKRADLVVSGASGELDRQVLERMLPPLEHMLRNSVVHGIETPDERKAAGKSDMGTIRIELHREGSEMVIAVEDDGRGIDVKAVRARAKERGLLKDGRNLTDEEALQLVLEPGFSTAASVTQHAGRGVGMDVVVAEIKKLGGALFTKSTPGQGVRFTIHLPFTLAISQALIVRIGEEMFALPLPTVEGVARVPRAEVAALLAKPDSVYTYGSQPYHVQHLGAFIDAPASTLPDADVPVPIILVNAGEHSTGLVVDELVGNREIVVKPVGPQISGIRGVAGATILGDGRIVVILDMGALVRSGWRASTGVAAPVEDRRTFALVVDDSITVRRVTQRLLERNGMRVATAKDGVDALAVLQDQIPDIILLDIEMPRMDGYEFAAQVRNDPRVSDIPIVMITSRVGEKHRARAIELGVNDYLGKPYQENQLLDAIEPLVEARRRRAAARARA